MIVTEREALGKRKEQEETELEAILDQNTTVGGKAKGVKGQEQAVNTADFKKKLNDQKN